MDNERIRDYITVEDEDGVEKKFAVEALFGIEDRTYAFLRSESDADDTIVMQIEEDDDEQYLVGINDDSKKQAILDAYEIAVEANPAD